MGIDVSQAVTLIMSNKITKAMAIKNIQRDPNKMARASYRNGSFGRRWSKTLKECFKVLGYNMDLNGNSTSIGIGIMNKLEKEGYSYLDNYSRYDKKEVC